MFSPCREKIIKEKGYVKYKYNDQQKGRCFEVNYYNLLIIQVFLHF